MFVPFDCYASHQIATESGSFVRLVDGSVAHLSRVASAATTHEVISRNQVFHRGTLPDFAVPAAEQDRPFLLFVERAPDAFVFMGSARCVMLRYVGGVASEIALATEAPLPLEIIAAFAPEVLSATEPEPASVDAFIELRRVAETWTARCIGLGQEERAHGFTEALSAVEQGMPELLLGRRRHDAGFELPRPDTSGMRRVRAGDAWPWTEIIGSWFGSTCSLPISPRLGGRCVARSAGTDGKRRECYPDHSRPLSAG